MMKKYATRALVGILIIVLFASSVGCTSNSKVFSKDKWEKYPERRIQMIDSLVEEYTIIGLSKEEIKDLLGEKEMLVDNPDMIEYFISPGTVDVVGFIIFFCDDGIAYQYKISPH